MRVAMGILQNLRERFRSRQQGDASRSQGDASRSLDDPLRGEVKKKVAAAFREALESPKLNIELVPATPPKKGLGLNEGDWGTKVKKILKLLGEHKYPPLNAAVIALKTHQLSLNRGITLIADEIVAEIQKGKKGSDQIA
jgi:hypothetical protein